MTVDPSKGQVMSIDVNCHRFRWARPVTDSLTILELKTRLGPPHLVELTWEARGLPG